MTGFAALKPKTYTYLTVMKIKKQMTQKSVIKRKLKFENYKHQLEATQLESK